MNNRTIAFVGVFFVPFITYLQCLPKVLGTHDEINEKIQMLCLTNISMIIVMLEASLPLERGEGKVAESMLKSTSGVPTLLAGIVALSS